MQLRYINTANTSGGDGTQDLTSGANRAFASLADAMSSLGSGTLTDRYRVFAKGTAADTSTCNQAHMAFTTTPDNIVEVIGDNFGNYKYDTSKYRLELTDNDAIYNNNASHVRLFGIQVQLTVSTSTGNDYNCFRLATANNNVPCEHWFVNCIAKGVVSGGATDHVFGFINSDTTRGGRCIVFCSLAYGLYTGFTSDATAWASANLYHANCTGWGNQFNFVDKMVPINCVSANALGGGGAYTSVSGIGARNNCADDATAPGANAQQNQTFTFSNTAGEDFRLSTSDTGARAKGIIAPLGPNFMTDIDNMIRYGLWDAGFDQQATVVGYPAINIPGFAYARHPKNFLFRRSP